MRSLVSLLAAVALVLAAAAPAAAQSASAHDAGSHLFRASVQADAASLDAFPAVDVPEAGAEGARRPGHRPVARQAFAGVPRRAPAPAPPGVALPKLVRVALPT